MPVFGEQFALETIFVGHKARQVRIIGIGLWHQIEQVECAAGSGCQIGGDGRNNTSRRAGDYKYAVGAQGQARLAIGGRLFLQTDSPPLAFFVPDLDRARIAQGLLDKDLASSDASHPSSKSTALTVTSALSRLYVLVIPTTGPPSGAIAPAWSYPCCPPSRVAETRKVPGAAICSYRARMVV